MGAWIKHFKDGAEERGYDKDVDEGRASWSKGRLDDIRQVYLKGFDSQVSLKLPDTEWHQFDMMIVPVSVGQHKPTRVARVLQAKIGIEHTDCFIQETTHKDGSIEKKDYSFKNDLPSANVVASYIQVEKKYFDKWFTVVIDDMGVRVLFSEKGKV